MTDADLQLLMLAGLAGDATAQTRLLAACAERLRVYYGRRLARQEADVEDLVQETLIAIHYRRASYDPGLPFTAWLYGIARYKLIDFFRRAHARATVPLGELPEEVAASPDADPLAGDDVERLLGLLPPRQAAAIRLTRLEGLSIEEAAARSGQSASGVKVGVHRGLLKLTSLFAGKPAP